MIAQETNLHAGARPCSRLERFFRHYPGWASFAALAIGDLVLVGWRSDIEALKSLVPGLVGMNPMTAFALALSGLSLWLLRNRDGHAREVRFGRAFATAVACIGALRLFGYLGGWDRGVDTLFFGDKLEMASGGWRSRMTPDAAAACILIGASLTLLDVKSRRWRRPSEFLALGVIFLSLFGIVGHAYGAGSLDGSSNQVGMALHTATVLLALGLGVLCARSDEGLVVLWTSETPGGAVTRRLMPAVLGVPIVLGWLRLMGQRAGHYDTSTGTALFVIATVVSLAVLVHRGAEAFNRSDAELRRNRAVFLSLFESLPGPHLLLTPDRRIVTANDAYLRATRTRREDLGGGDIFEVLRDDPAANGLTDSPASLDRVPRTLEADAVTFEQHDPRQSDGTFVARYASPINSPVLGADGKLEYILHRVEDVTEFLRQTSPAEDGTAEPGSRREQIEARVFQSSRKA